MSINKLKMARSAKAGGDTTKKLDPERQGRGQSANERGVRAPAKGGQSAKVNECR
jgi:hypothetical protein